MGVFSSFSFLVFFLFLSQWKKRWLWTRLLVVFQFEPTSWIFWLINLSPCTSLTRVHEAESQDPQNESHMKGLTPLPLSWHLSPASTHSSKHAFSWHPASFSQLSTEENIIPCFHRDFNYIRVFLNYIRIFQLSLLVLFICNIFTPLFHFPYGNTFCFVKETKERIDRRISDQSILIKSLIASPTLLCSIISFWWWICFCSSAIWSLFIWWLTMEIFLSFYRW